MNIKVQIQFDLWPYSEAHTVHITPEEFKNMDKMVDSITSNLKMRLLSHVRTHHPDIWYQYTPFNEKSLNDLKIDPT